MPLVEQVQSARTAALVQALGIARKRHAGVDDIALSERHSLYDRVFSERLTQSDRVLRGLHAVRPSSGRAFGALGRCSQPVRLPSRLLVDQTQASASFVLQCRAPRRGRDPRIAPGAVPLSQNGYGPPHPLPSRGLTYMYTCLYVHTHTHTHIYTHTYIYMHTYIVYV